MIISKTVNINLLPNNHKKYKNLGYEFDSNSTILNIKISDLSLGSHTIVSVTCDYCYSELEISYKKYNRSMSSGNKFACSSKCADLKRRELLLDSYGVDNLSKLEDVKEKRKKTILDKYGVEYASQSKEIIDRIKKTTLDRYGVENYTKTEEYIKKCNETNLERYGVKWALQSPIVKEKSKSTNLIKYGFEHASQSPKVKLKAEITNIEKYGFKSPTQLDEIKQKVKSTNIIRYGVETPTKLSEIKQKTKITNLEKYGVDYPMQSLDIKQKRLKNNIKKWNAVNNTASDLFRTVSTTLGSNDNYIKYIGDEISLFSCEKGHNFELHSDNYFSRQRQNIPLCTICYPINNSISIGETELYKYIFENYTGEIIRSYRDVIEIDIYLPDLKIGFEFNGLYWHSEDKKGKNYHLNKTEYFSNKGIRIIHIWEDDFKFKSSIIKSQINNILGLSNKIFARKCNIQVLEDNKVISDFLNNNHLQGYYKSITKTIGLYYQNELVSVMTFDKFEGRKKMNDNEWNLSRFCNKLNTTVIGSASKMLKWFINNNYNTTRIISYADKDWSTGDLYKKLGFNMISQGNPDYKYIIDGKRTHKSKYRKSKLGLNSKITESKFMKNLNIERIWDCGKIKFECRFD